MLRRDIGGSVAADRFMREIRSVAQLHHPHLLEGGLQRAAGRLRVTLRLIRARDAIAVWARSYDFGPEELPLAARRR